MVGLTLIEILQGVFMLIYLIIAFILGIKIILKFFKYRITQQLLVGISLLGLASIYLIDGIAFVIRITSNVIIDEKYYIFSILFIPIFQITWIIVITDFLIKDKQKIIVILITIEGIIYEIVLIYFFFVDFSILGYLGPGIYMTWSPLVIAFSIFALGLFLITGVIFSIEALKSENEQIRLKGKFLIIALISYTIGTLIDLVDLAEITSILPRIILLFAAIQFYIGFTLPEKIKNIFIKKS